MRVRDMTRGSATGLILSTALPLMLGNMFQQLYTIVDASVVGRGIGLQALAALGSADWFNWLFFSIALGFAQGFSIPVAQAFGAKDYAELRRVAGNALFLGMLTSMAITVIALLVISPVLCLMGTPDEVMPMAAAYLRVLFSLTAAGHDAVLDCQHAAGLCVCVWLWMGCRECGGGDGYRSGSLFCVLPAST